MTIGVAGISNIAYAGPMEVALPFLIQSTRHAGVNALGWFYSASSLGAVLAAVWLGRVVHLRRRGWLLYGAWMLIGLMVVLIGLPVPLPAVLAASLVIGAANSVLGLVWVNSLQEVVPRHLLGRVSSVDYLGSYLLLPAAFAPGCWATGSIGAPLVFILGGALQTLLVVLGLLHPKVRGMD